MTPQQAWHVDDAEAAAESAEWLVARWHDAIPTTLKEQNLLQLQMADIVERDCEVSRIDALMAVAVAFRRRFPVNRFMTTQQAA